jgi:hypothetical protein
MEVISSTHKAIQFLEPMQVRNTLIDVTLKVFPSFIINKYVSEHI